MELACRVPVGNKSPGDGLDVHISIVNHENADQLARCLRSLPAACLGVTWRVTVVDNASTDASLSILTRDFPDVDVLCNRQRKGFGANHNQVIRPFLAARLARYILVLNDDTELHELAVTRLVEHMDRRPDLGASSPSLLDQDGASGPSRLAFPTIRSSLAFDFRGVTEAPDDGGWLTGCALLLRREALEDVGAFDERFFLFYEDVDLSRRLINAGWSLGECPDARVTHFSHGTVLRPSLADSTMRHSRRSRHLYFAKWHGGLRAWAVTVLGSVLLLVRTAREWVGGRGGRDPDRGRRARQQLGLALSTLMGAPQRRPHILIATNMVPSPHSSSGEQRLIRLCHLLLESADVDLVVHNEWVPFDHEERIRELGRTGIRLTTDRRHQAVDVSLSRRRYDAVVIEFWHVAEDVLPRVRALQPWAPIVIDTVDLAFIRDGRAAQQGQENAAAVAARRLRELDVLERSDGAILVSQTESAIFGDLARSPLPTWVIPNITESVPRARHEREPVVLFVGAFWHPPNLHGLTWFCDDVWPSVRQQVPEARLVIVGSQPGPEATALRRHPGVEVVGFVEDLEPIYDAVTLAVAPLRFGAGMKGKVTEALAHGLPVASTPIGAEGLEEIIGRGLFVDDGPEEMAGQIVDLLTDPELAAQSGAAGQSALSSICSPRALRPTVVDLLSSIPMRSSSPKERLFWQAARFSVMVAAGLRSLGRRLRLAVSR
jgi:GT2 family glycosyltransferase/glycosyltransferase involved in cell wall biosynthesis